MILGIGTDLVDSRRIANSLDRFGTRFETRIFTEKEIEIARNRPDPSLFYAKRFAVKEAVYKALSAAGVAGLGWREAETLNDTNGAPKLYLSGACKTALERLTPEGYKASVHISLTDELPYAQAFVIVSATPINTGT
ncbi:holo-ACP synthase [Candidatus Puniceispirillum sp.]|jgi:holo-[acyl-carrier protein] synthase|uniref:holo-ACP synthase n=1 Tax=Candidatus Puniceispirillum sp. TaxID=2026719 RepID=UPI001ECFF48C|nr:holo-ACP synthase [Candidatus Puniceispirillum sp.]MBT6566094.1 holo-ACP synthase [Candidatus Puniceispirillum sp.]